jgi:NADPH-dependent 2,4-dienoyl-CoA reductase/sulfur reductase-like enzyme/CxxC motif-containing protein
MRDAHYDVTVIGAGPAGIAAAIGAREAGAGRVLLVDRDHRLGGILNQCVHAGFGAVCFDAELTGPEYAERWVSRLLSSDVETALHTSVVDARRGGRLTLSSAERGVRGIETGAVVLAMGCRERTRGGAVIPGSRPAGIFSAGTAQRLINVDGLMVGREVVVVGSGDVGLIMARRCVLEGARVHAVIERLPWPGGCSRNVAQCLDDFGIPLHLGHTVTSISGLYRVDGVSFGPVHGGGEKRIDCDTVLFSIGLVPEIELARLLEVPLDPVTGGPFIDSGGQTLQAGVFACGNLVQPYDLVDLVSRDAERVGAGAAAFARDPGAARGRIPLQPGRGIRSLTPQFLDAGGAAGASLCCRVDRRYRRARFVLRDGDRIATAVEREYVVPAEMVTLGIDELLRGAHRPGRFTLEVEGEEMESAPAAGASDGAVRCIVCPASCLLRVDGSAGALKVRGARCSKGIAYAEQEYRDPRRLFTSTAVLLGGDTPRVPVRSLRPIARGDWKKAMEVVATLRVRAPVSCGQVLVDGFVEPGNTLVAAQSAARFPS